ncbi:MAG TPA: adenosylcobinamide-phosphate synthase CbiB [Candidatus Competibacter sp.]|nr:cobalamin biosynthesis protein [Candidatus Competibacteraceae bacterium]HRE54211.1 adenosylcobinamide-phosphate synthase CbiB [Candidatus Competibacter sp.]HUM95526.1 adenosylcobinamide-phosphate synthase CbiB [Candidatus Competibacter sp.]
MLTALMCIGAVLLDRGLGEPRRWHPLVGFGGLARRVEAFAYGPPETTARVRRGRGVGAVVVLLVPFALAAWQVSALPLVGSAAALGLLYLAIGARSLAEHAEAVAAALKAGDLPLARERVGLIVSRDTEELDEEHISRATVESVLENGCDAIFGALFWFVLAGAPGVVLYRLANTLDAMWGYRTARYRDYGWAAARLDDLLNGLPARLTALSYLAVGSHPALAWRCWRTQAPVWKSPNAGPVMAAGAGALGLALGGPARYHGEWQPRPALGEGLAPRADDIGRAVALVRRALGLWLAVILVGGWLFA